ncbi:hypothetical protein [Aliiglaciecola litoralis]|uniref:Uncharacterized protein n=1 Tax=Aliiglaciecola litoralis TaxID=582857 RepID=A0ABN1LFP4_9ALTE
MYFILGSSIEDVGDYPQHQTMGDRYDYDGKCSVYNLLRDFEFTPNFSGAKIERKAKRTDLISSVPIPCNCLIFNDNLKNLLGQFKMPPHRLFQLPLKHKWRTYSYWCLQIVEPEDIFSYLDFSETNFFVKSFDTNKRQKINVANEQELCELKRTLSSDQDLYNTSYRFKEGYLGRYDLFTNGFLDIDIYISESLRNALDSSSFSGVSIGKSRLLKW